MLTRRRSFLIMTCSTKLVKQGVLAAALALCGLAAAAADKVTVQLKWVPQAQFAGY